MQRSVFGVVLALGALPAAAQEVSCIEAQTQVEMTRCAEMDWMAADDRLNAAYGDAMRAMKALDAALPKAEQGAAAALKQAQRAWIPFRDAACTAEAYMMHGGSAEPMLIYGCRARLTDERTEGLMMLAEDRE